MQAEPAPALVRQISAKVHHALLERLPQLPAEVRAPDLEGLAREIALELGRQLENPRLQLRSLLWNLRDTRNSDFVRQVAARAITPQQLPTLPSECMASAAKRTEREALLERHTKALTLQAGLAELQEIQRNLRETGDAATITGSKMIGD